MSSPKAHHFVPQFLLREFTDADGWLHWTRVGLPKPVIRRAKPTEVFVKNHLYSLVDEQGLKDPKLEHLLAALETDAAVVVAKILAAARSERPPDLSARERGIWYAFFLTQWRRTPESQQAVATDAEVDAMLTDVLEEAKERFPDRPDEIEALDTPVARARIIRNVRTQGILRLSNEVMPVLRRRGLAIAKIRAPRKAFVIGSRPVVKYTIAGISDLNDPTVEVWLPVSSDVAVGVGPGNANVRLYFLYDARLVRQINNGTARASSVIAGASPTLVGSLARANPAPRES